MREWDESSQQNRKHSFRQQCQIKASESVPHSRHSQFCCCQGPTQRSQVQRRGREEEEGGRLLLEEQVDNEMRRSRAFSGKSSEPEEDRAFLRPAVWNKEGSRSTGRLGLRWRHCSPSSSRRAIHLRNTGSAVSDLGSGNRFQLLTF